MELTKITTEDFHNKLKEIKTKDQITITKSDIFHGIAVQGLYLFGVDLSSISFRGCFMEKLKIRNCDFRGCDFSGAIIKQVTIDHSVFDDANFTESQISMAEIRNSCLRNTIFHHAILKGVDIKSSDVSGINIQCSSLQYVHTLNIKVD